MNSTEVMAIDDAESGFCGCQLGQVLVLQVCVDLGFLGIGLVLQVKLSNI